VPTFLIVNADDLGYDPSIDGGILEAHARGIVTAATAMVDTPFAARALAQAPATLDVGLHVVVSAGEGGLEEQIARQLERFRALRGAAPTHLDSHRHAHAAPGALAAFAAAARREAIPLRALDPAMRATLRAAGVATTDAFLGDAALRPCWTRERLLGALSALPTGTVELMCHPGRAPTHARTSFSVEREIELASLIDPGARAALAASGAVLGTFPGRPPPA
jgi:chitin disaccharide deacetylase